MRRKLIPITLATLAALAGAAGANAAERVYRVDEDHAWRIARAPDWNITAADGMCRLHIWVDDRARIQLHGDQIIVKTESGKRAFDQGSVCTQPLPTHPVDNFHVEVARGRGTVMEVREPHRRNDYTGAVTVVDPENGGDTYELVMAWHNPDVAPAPPVVYNAPAYPLYDQTRACQDKVRAEFLQRNRDGDAYVEFTGAATRDEFRRDRERIRGEAWARNRTESRPISYECIVNERENRVLSASYDLQGRPRLSSLQ